MNNSIGQEFSYNSNFLKAFIKATQNSIIIIMMKKLVIMMQCILELSSTSGDKNPLQHNTKFVYC